MNLHFAQKRLILSAALLLSPILFLAQSLHTFTNQVIEWHLQSEKSYENPFRNIDLEVTVTHQESGRRQIISAFWAGKNTWTIRFSSPVSGTYSYLTHCSDGSNKGLHQQKGQIVVEPYVGDHPLYRHGPVRVSARGPHLEHYDGTPFFWLADSWWHGMTTRFGFPADFETLATDRKNKGFNVIQFAIGFPCDIEPFDPRGQNEAGDPWDEAFTSINPSYFDLTDQRLEKLLEMGFVPNIVGLWGYYMKWMGVENAKKHWQYLIARYAAYPVTFSLTGETTLAYYPDMEEEWDYYKDLFRSQWSEVAKFIQENDPYDRLLTTHPGPGINDGKNPIYEMQYLDMVMLQSGHQAFATVPKSTRFIKEYQNRFPDKPVIHGEVCFEGMFGSSWQDVQRLLFWSNVLQGTPGFSYGVEGIWQFNTTEKPFGPSPSGHVWGNVPWQEAMHYKGSEQVGHSAQFVRQLPWWKLRPAPERVSKHADIEQIYDPYAAEVGEDLLVYFRFAFGKNTLKIRGLEPGAPYEFVFFDPITGKSYPPREGQSNARGEWLVPTPPVIQDWVLWLRPVAK